MPKLTAEQRAALEQQLAEDDAAGDDDFDFDYSEGDRSVRMPWSKREALAELGFKGLPKKPAAKPQGGGGQDDKGAGSAVPIFGGGQRRRTGSS